MINVLKHYDFDGETCQIQRHLNFLIKRVIIIVREIG